MNTPLRLAVSVVTTAALAVGAVAPQASAAEARSSVEAWVTNLAVGRHLDHTRVGRWRSGHTPSGSTIVVDPSRHYQTMVGFGASLTDSAAYDLATLDAPTRVRVMAQLFSERDGIGVSMLRQPMGASDLSAHGNYSYDDMPAGQTDPDLAHFSIAYDRQQIIPLLQQALQHNPNLTVMATPWSPPGWMKTSDSMIGGTLQPQYYQPYADYFAKMISAYEAAGVPITYVTAQNEPLYSPTGYPGMSLPAEQAATFIGDYLGPTLARSAPETTILGYDHNWDNTDYPETMFTDSRARRYVPATAWHCYGGTVSAQTVSHNDFPGRGAFMTECSGGEWQGDEAESFAQTIQTVIGAPRNWAKSVILWNLALDDDHGPTNGGCTNCRGLVTVHDDGTATPTVDYWALGQTSRFVRPGAVRLGSSIPSGAPMINVAYRNPDGSTVLVVYNQTGTDQSFAIREGNRHVSTSLPAGAAATYRWAGQAHGTARSDLGYADLHVGRSDGAPLVQTVGPEEVAAMNQVRVGGRWLGYSLPHDAQLRPDGTATTLARTGWSVTASSSASGDDPQQMLDGDPATRWSTGTGQAPGQWIRLDLERSTTFDEIVLDATASPGDYPRRYEVETSTDGQHWEPIARGQGTAGTTTIVLPRTTTRYVRISTLADSGSWWSIHELAVRSHAAQRDARLRLPRPTYTSDRGRLDDGTRLLGLANLDDAARTYDLGIGGHRYRYTLPRSAAATFAVIPASEV